jgi:tRNA(Ile2) C34 agmatinyltransferase TiaS
MSYQYTYCPTCGTRRVGHGFRCTVCDRALPRKPLSDRVQPSVIHTLVTWRQPEPERKPVAA